MFRLAKIFKLQVLGLFNLFRRRRLQAMESLEHHRIANMLLLESEEFSLDPNGSNSRNALFADGVDGSVGIPRVREFGFTHRAQANDTGQNRKR
jgi:hypothetical protein